MIPPIFFTPLLSRFIKLKLPEYDLEFFTVICQKVLSRKYDKDHETIQSIVQYVREHTREIREAIITAKIVDTSDEVNGIASTLRRYSNEMGANLEEEFIMSIKLITISALVVASMILIPSTTLQASSKGLKLYLTIDTNLNDDVRINTYQHGDRVFTYNAVISR